MLQIRFISTAVLAFICALTGQSSLEASQAEGLHSEQLFDYVPDHVHGSTIVELPDGDLLLAWFQGSGERTAEDVRIMGSRKDKGSSVWSEPFLLADTPGFPDINPVLFLDPQESLWLVWYTVIAHQWDTSLLKYRISSHYEEGSPRWEWQEVLHVKPGTDYAGYGVQPDDSFVETVERKMREYVDYLKEEALATRSHYPAIIQGADATLHVSYSFHRNDKGDDPHKTIKYAHLTEQWIREGLHY